MILPLFVAEFIFGLPLLRRPVYLVKIVPESPSEEELPPDLLLIEIREGHFKWAHIKCPKCGDHISLPLAGKERWKINIDLLRKPTIEPSIWESQTCGGHFFVRKGSILGIQDQSYEGD